MPIALRNTLDLLIMAAMWSVGCIALGFAARVAVFLFCVGYGCTP